MMTYRVGIIGVCHVHVHNVANIFKSHPQVDLVAVADTLHKAVDTAIQLCGAHGYSRDTVLEWIYRYARQARLVDGASEVHKMVLSRHLLNEGMEFWSWN